MHDLTPPSPDRLCSECGTTWTDDPGGVCSACLPDAAAREPGSISQEQRRQIAALLLVREPVARVESMMSFVTGALGREFGPNDSLWQLSAKEGGDLLEALENDRRAAPELTARVPRGTAYQGKRHAGGRARRPSQGAHRARN